MSNDFTTNAFNFTSAIKTQVDPRTGQFLANLPIASLLGNNRLGPNLDLSLGYSPLSSYNMGFGKGFSLSGTTQLNLISSSLTLSNGENYKIIKGTIKVRDQKLQNFKLEFTNSVDDSKGYTIFWKEGKIERLERVSEGLYVTKKIISPLGRELNIQWVWTGSQAHLTNIEDEYETLLNIEYNGSNNIIHVWPNSKESYKIRSLITNEINLTNLSLLTESETLNWSFTYSKVESSDLLLTEINYPTGLREFVSYSQSQGFKPPSSSSGLNNTPAVISHTIVPGGSQPNTVTSYEYSNQNFLGFNSNFGQWDSDSDYIYTTLTDYTYWSKATTSSSDDTIITTRTYNNYHLQVSEEVRNKNSITLSEIEYYAEPYVFIESQPNQFQLPKRQVSTWKDTSLNQSRSEVVETEFDEYGNPIWQKDPDGTITETKWYSSEGESDCPKEPNGFTRFIKEEIVTPPQVEEAGYKSPVNRTVYTYKNLGNTSCVVKDSESSYSNDILLQKSITKYNEVKNSEFGRVIEISNTVFSTENSDSYTNKFTIETTPSEDIFSTKTTCIGFDGIQFSSIKNISPYKGLLLSEIDTKGIQTSYTYDYLSRISSRTLADDTKYESTTTWEYKNSNGVLKVSETDSKGNSLRTSYDSTGREILKELLDTDTSQEWYTIESKEYNSIGETISSESNDWIISSNKSSEKINLKEKYAYDQWGQLSNTTLKNNIQYIQEVSPIGLTTYETREAQNLKSFSSLTNFDNNGLPLSQIIKDSKGIKISEKSMKYDGQGKIFEEQDELGNITRYTYDVWGRIETQTLPDNTQIKRTYAQHLLEDKVTSITVTGKDNKGNTKTWILGTQEFDSLGRLTKTTSGGRTTSFTYEGISDTPTTTTTPAGEVIKNSLIPELGDAISQVKVGNIIQTFEFDPITSLPTKAQENNGSEIENFWKTSGAPKSTTSLIKGEEEREAFFKSTLQKQLLEYKDFTGKTSEYIRNEYGLIEEIIDDEVSLNLEYDEFSRIISQKTINSKHNTSLKIELKYNDIDQEIYRKVIDSQGGEVEITQIWNKKGQIEQKRTSVNNQVLAENYEYDNRSRLVSYSAQGSPLPKDAYGNTFSEQSYKYDALNNITSLTTTLEDGSSNVTTFFFDNQKDPTQLTSLSHSHSKYPEEISLEYDENGYMTKDEEGRKLTYDSLGRLIEIQGKDTPGGSYSYDPLNRLIQKKVNQGKSYSLYYDGEEVVNQVIDQKDLSRLIKIGSQSLAVSLNDQITLTASNMSNTLLWSHEENEESGEFHSFSPYGEGEASDLIPAFNGELKDPISETYHLGNGYRSYSPKLMRFNAPDSLSPFGGGGINPYAYCLGDPINNVDPSGHISWQGWVGIGMGILSIMAAGVTGGMSIAASGGIMAAISSASTSTLILGTLNIISDVVSIVSGPLEAAYPESSAILGWISFATGIVGIGTSIASFGSSLFKAKGSYNLESATKAAGLFSKDGAFVTSMSINMKILNASIKESSHFNVFTDATRNKGPGRLNINCHGTKRKWYRKTTAGFIDKERNIKSLSPKKLAAAISEYNDDSINRVRLLMCHSADGGTDSFAAKLARKIGKPVKGYEGTVRTDNVTAHLEVSMAIYNIPKSEGGYMFSKVINNIERQGKFIVEKDPFYINMKGVEAYNNYRPVWFDASGNIMPPKVR